MKKILFVFLAILFFAASADALTRREIDKYLKTYVENGYRFVRADGKNTWHISFKLPDWETEWPIVVILLKDESGNEVIGIGTTVFSSEKEPSSAVLKYILERNIDDMNIGSFGLYHSGSYMIQYWIKIPKQYAVKEQLAYVLGFVAGYANAIGPEIKKIY
ncbi:MAG: hypothetical protein PHF84_03570 [bacterium]|nr:hypothetical protein [bacterium]